MSEIGDRLKQERQRLGLTQPAFAAACGAAKRTLIDWENGASSPTAVQLSALMGHGVDVVFVLTGTRGVPPALVLNAKEHDLLDHYRAAADVGKAALETTAALFAAARQGDKS